MYCSGVEKEAVQRKVEKICAERWPIELPDGDMLELSATAGIAAVPADGTEMTELYRRADSALYEAKARGKARFAIHRDGRSDA